MVMYDVIVIGSGLSGLISASVSSKAGKSVLVISKGLGNIYSSSGFIDILGYYPPERKLPRKNIKEAMKELCAFGSQHPYKIIGQEAVDEACDFFINLTEIIGYPYSGNSEENKLLPTAAGALAPTALVPPTATCNIADFEKILVVGFEEYIDFYPSYVAENLKCEFKKHNLNADVESKTVKLGLDTTRELNSYDIAVQMENSQIFNRVVDVLKGKVGKNTLVAMPAVLGVTKWQQVYYGLKEELNCEILEIPTLPPSITGMRLAEGIKDYLSSLEVEFHMGYQAKGITGDGTCQGITVESAGGKIKTYKAESYVLATGGILGGGINSTPRTFEEMVFGIPVAAPDGNWSVNDFFAPGGQPYAYSGIKVNEKLNPLDEKGNVLLANVYCAGKNLAGYDPFVEKSGNGVALTTGYQAGVAAVKGCDRK